MEYKVMINEFEGPLDLLLHLIKENNIDIYDIKIEEITKQYLDYIKKMKELNLSIASEYLVMASELLEMKSKMLLPKREEETLDDFEEDPRELLIERLLAYKQYGQWSLAVYPSLETFFPQFSQINSSSFIINLFKLITF